MFSTSLRLFKESSQLVRHLRTSLSIHHNAAPTAVIKTFISPFSCSSSTAATSNASSRNVDRGFLAATMSLRSPFGLPLLDITPPGRPSPAIENPLIVPSLSIDDPTANVVKEIMDKITDMPALQDLEMPAGNNHTGDEGIQAAVLIGIRRRKMKKHKLKKLRKKMKFEWAKVRQRRELRKEKAFQAVLISQIKVAEKFSAEAYVAEKLRQANETPIPRFWKGRRLPEFLIREKLAGK